MPRIRLSLPEKKLFSTQMQVAVTDLNYGNHVGNQYFLSYAHEVRLRYLSSLNQSELNCFGQSLIMSDCAINYRGELFWGDNFHVDIYTGGCEKFGFDLYYHFYQTKDQAPNSKDIALIKTGLLFFDYDQRKVVTAPCAAYDHLGHYQS